jgi:uncharacterized protein (TIGR02246 family)
MPVNDQDRVLVEDMLKAMQAGPAGEQQLLSLFTEDAVLVEPFTGNVQTHNGKKAIQASLAEMAKTRVPDLTLRLDRIDLDGDRLRAEWTCTSAMMPAPMKGVDFVTVRGGRIGRLEIVITEMPR